jgi:hypothetical protein
MNVPSNRALSKCQSCDASIEWGIFPDSGRAAPFDVESAPAREGDVRWRLELGHDDRGTARLYAQRAEVGEPGVLSHYATCPDADRWRRGR